MINLGYKLYPPAYSHAPGHARVDVLIWNEPTHRHFDPESMELSVISDKRRPISLKISHRQYAESVQREKLFERHYEVAASVIRIVDRKHKVVEFFTCGGDFWVNHRMPFSLCILKSPAPIMPMNHGNTISVLLVEQLLILLAMRRADWIFDKNKYESRLADIKPFDFYTACLVSLREKYAHFPYYKMIEHVKLHNFILEEIEILREHNQWPVYSPTLKQIL